MKSGSGQRKMQLLECGEKSAEEAVTYATLLKGDSAISAKLFSAVRTST
jgi:hypothetical protein